MTRNDWRKVDAAINAAVESVGKKFDLKIGTKGFRFSDTESLFKLEAVVTKVDGKAFDQAKADFKEFAWRFNLKASDFGKTFESQGKEFKITGLKLRGHKYNVLADEVSTGKKYKFDASDVREKLAPSGRGGKAFGKWVRAYRGEPCMECGKAATSVNAASICKKCFQAAA